MRSIRKAGASISAVARMAMAGARADGASVRKPAAMGATKARSFNALKLLPAEISSPPGVQGKAAGHVPAAFAYRARGACFRAGHLRWCDKARGGKHP